MFKVSRMLLAAALICVGFGATAQTTRLRGTIESVDSNRLTVSLSDGTRAQLMLAPSSTIVAVVKASISDIKEGTFVGSAALPQPDGTQRALEVHIFPEEMRGVGEGHRPYAPVPQGTMTNGSTAGPPVVTGVQGSTLTVKYKGGEKKIIVPPDTPIVRFLSGSANDLKPAAHFTVTAATKNPDGTYEANRINVGRDGVAPS
ncbi:MAG TPA: hypothetical protein VN649_08535 [Ramlibacter sp.]|nr:hypothetical protein [Ramlibacter sp.]